MTGVQTCALPIYIKLLLLKSQVHEPPDKNEIHTVQRQMCQVRNQYLKEKLDHVKGSVSGKPLRVVDLATQKGASS